MMEIGELKVPIALRPVFEEIVGITDAVCLAVLDEEYTDLARRAAAKLARKRPRRWPVAAGPRGRLGLCMPWVRPISCSTRRASPV